VAVNLVAT